MKLGSDLFYQRKIYINGELNFNLTTKFLEEVKLSQCSTSTLSCHVHAGEILTFMFCRHIIMCRWNGTRAGCWQSVGESSPTLGLTSMVMSPMFRLDGKAKEVIVYIHQPSILGQVFSRELDPQDALDYTTCKKVLMVKRPSLLGLVRIRKGTESGLGEKANLILSISEVRRGCRLMGEAGRVGVSWKGGTIYHEVSFEVSCFFLN